jgi:alpha-beta hydrolase superfamily lysophospholipase
MTFERVVVGFCALLVAFNMQCMSVYAQEVNAADRITVVVDGERSKQLHIPLYEWYPKDKETIGMLLAIHGLTLHGNTYEVLGKAFAANGFYACAPDMRGFGRCYTDKEQVFAVGGVSKQSVDYEGSYADIVALAHSLKRDHPNLPLFVMGESLGSSMCVRLAAEHPELVTGLLMSGPTVKINPIMVLHPDNVLAAGWALFFHPRFRMLTTSFVKNLVSNDPDIVEELLRDPLCRKGLTIAELLKTRRFVSRTLSTAAKIREELPVLVVQGSKDRCMVPRAVTKLVCNIPSSNQTIRWLHAHGHLLFETRYLRPATLDSIDIWVRANSPSRDKEIAEIKTEILQLGGKEPRH